MSEQQLTSVKCVVPASIMTKADVARLVSEAETLDTAFTNATIRARTGGVVPTFPALSQQLSDFILANQLEIRDAEQCGQLLMLLRQFKATMPTVHLSFASPVDQSSLQQIVAWLRKSVHAQAIVVVGLQPSLIGGVYIRTTNRAFDLSLRARLAGRHDVLVKDLEALVGSR